MSKHQCEGFGTGQRFSKAASMLAVSLKTACSKANFGVPRDHQESGGSATKTRVAGLQVTSGQAMTNRRTKPVMRICLPTCWLVGATLGAGWMYEFWRIV